MITDAVMAWFADMLIKAISLIPPLPDAATDWLDQAVNAINSLIGKVAIFEPIIPFSTLGGCLTAIGVALGFALLCEVVRLVLSYLTLGGGST